MAFLPPILLREPVKGPFFFVAFSAALGLWLGRAPVASASGVQAVEEALAELALDGVIVASNPADSVALLRRVDARRARPLRMGQTFEGYVLLEVSKRSVRLGSADREVWLFIQSAAGSAAGRTPLAPTAPGDGDDVWIRRAFSRAETRERLRKEIPVILREAEFVPRVEDGEVQGIGVRRLPDGTLLSESGLLPGDVLLSINGAPIHRVDSLWELLARLVEEEEIRVVVRRRGELVKLAYAFTN